MTIQALEPVIRSALEQRGFAQLTPVQQAVLAPEARGRDLRITSQTGSGKTVAIGFALRALALDGAPAAQGVARPRALVVAPTRELAKQVEAELRWLYAGAGVRLASVTGGASYREELRALAAGPAVVVGTPGRLLDHLRRGSIETAVVGAVVLDEADRMLDMGFREDLDAIVALLPAERHTHLVSATFPRSVQALADRAQRDAVHVEGTELGAANADIDHVIHLVDPSEKLQALHNLLLASPDAQTLVFARTRAGVGEVVGELARAGFRVAALSGELDQAARTRALAAFKRGDVQVLVATDVAARGIDVQDIARVIHMEMPTDPDSYTHRSGRTGRAGRRGTSAVLTAPAALAQALRVLRGADVAHRFEPIPSAESIRAAADERLVAELTSEDAGPPSAEAAALTARLVARGLAERALARLLSREGASGAPEPREVRVIPPPAPRAKRAGRGESFAEPPRARGGRAPRPGLRHDVAAPRPHEAPRDRGARGAVDWVAFQVAWGAEQGADPRRLLAMLCRRGGVGSDRIGAIHVARRSSVVEVGADVALAFERAVRRGDTRDAGVGIRRVRGAPRAS
ncbi:MAG: DEAD/DEAH box helicase [Polyangiaceae bacterium]|nr:DEAD/DEAH box helicase [Polyangiaceae bacterium]